MKRRLGSLLALLGLCAAAAQAQLTVSIDSPLLGPGTERLQALVDQNLQGFSDQISAYIIENFDKPLFMEGFSRAAAVSVLVPGAALAPSFPYLSLGSSVAAFSADYSPEIVQTLESLPSEADAAAGACSQPFLFKAGFPLKAGKVNFDMGASLGFMNARAGLYELQAFSMGMGAGLVLGRGARGILGWEALRLEAGADFAVSQLSARFQTGRINQTVPIDPDGIGPLVGFNATFGIEPEAEAGIRSSVASFRLQASSGATLFRAVTLSLGAGAQAASARSALSLRVDGVPIIVEGYLSNLIETPGTISVSGRVSERSIAFVGAYLFGSLGFRIGAFGISVPLAWSIPGGLGLGASIGMEL